LSTIVCEKGLTAFRVKAQHSCVPENDKKGSNDMTTYAASPDEVAFALYTQAKRDGSTAREIVAYFGPMDAARFEVRWQGEEIAAKLAGMTGEERA
jgi:hypothetical protein